MRAPLIAACITLLLTTATAQAEERDAGCGPGIYCGDSPDDDEDPCTPQPDDPRTRDYDEAADDFSCDVQTVVLSIGEAEITPQEVLSPSLDWKTGGGNPPYPWRTGGT
jgi:hypothetical protein